MASAPRGPRSGNTGPGRPQQRRARTASRPSGSAPASPDEPTTTTPAVWLRGLRVTRRAMVLGLVLVVLALSYGGSLQIYLGQQHDLAVAEQQIRDRTAQVADLETELDRWDDPDYVRAQARARLGWVMPGETGYRVVGADGEPIGGGVTLESERGLAEGERAPVWWDRLLGSIETADAPARKVTRR
jgi:cell division protein FtsB